MAQNQNSGLAIDNRLMLLKPLIKEPITDYKPLLFLTSKEIQEGKEIPGKFEY